MNHDPLYQRLRDTGWRRDFTEAEAAQLQAWLAAHPEARLEWELDEQVSRVLRGLKDVPLASNFTARVVRAVERERAASAHGTPRRWWRPAAWAPRLAFVAVALAVGLFTYHQHEVNERRALGQRLAALADVTTVPSPEILRDFDAIRRLGQTPPADTVLLKVLE